MSDAILTLGLVLSGILLAYTTYAALYGLAGAFTGRTYERCPHCHHHYLADRAGATVHECGTGGRLLNPIHPFAGHGHHAHASRG